MEAQGYNAARIIRYTWAAIFLLSAIDVVWACCAGIQTRVLPFLDPMLALGGIAGVAIYRHFCPSLTRKGTFTLIYTSRPRALDGAWFTAILINQFAIGTLAIVIFSYLGAWLNYPLVDTQLSAVDHFLGFDWLAYITWVNAHPLVAHVLTCVYHAMDTEVLLILATFGILRQYAHLHRFILEFMSSAFITITLATIWPALGTHIYYKIAAAAYPNLQVLQAEIFANDLLSMRNHTMNVLPSYLQGLVTFPSLHTTFIILAIHLAGFLPSLWLRAPMIAFNIVMLCSVPIDGGHYFTDMLGGAVLGIAAIAFATWLVPCRGGKSQVASC